ncbi:MAG: GntR family transcriptional regulator [Lachnospiraceae bacterium]|nr:GntR family transcriptional regulator [Lachnospiraceae bacterium]
MNNSVLTDNAYDYILEQILNGEIKPGERIREDMIAEQLGTSRTPVREAVNQLVQNGFVIYIKRKGLYCVEITQQDLLNLLDLRRVLENLSYKRCMDAATEEDIQRLYDHIDKFQSYDKEERIKRHDHADIAFHNMLAEITKFSRLMKYIGEVETIMLIARANLKKRATIHDVIDLSWKLHRDIVKGIETKDYDLIQRTSDAHMQLMKDTQILVVE